VGGKIMKVHVAGLTQTQWIICVVVGFTALIWNAVLKFAPESCCPVFGDEQPEDVASAAADYEALRHRKTRGE